MLKFLMALLFLLVCSHAMATNFSGTYECHLTDHADGQSKGTLILQKDKTASFANIGYGSYLLRFQVQGIPYAYTGMAAARGNDLALYFESTGPSKNPDDRGVGIASITVDQDKAGNKIVSLHKFYYEKSYKGKSNYGFEKCIKIN